MSANSSGASVYALHPTIAGLYVGLTDSTSTAGIDPITFCIFRNVSPDTTANTYHHGCIAQVVSDGTGIESVYSNTGTYAAPVWTKFSADISGQFQSVSVVTNGGTLVPLFGPPTGFNGSLTSVSFTASDDASGTITLSSNGTTVATIVKGSQGSVKGSSIAVTAFTAAGSLNVVSSGGNGTLTATFITA